MDSSSVRTLLSHTVHLRQKARPDFVEIDEGFNVFKILGVQESELKHSALIADLLNPLGKHGLDSKFLHCFLARLGMKNAASGKWRATIEESHRQGRWDIALHGVIGNDKVLVVIENKINASESHKQLMRYRHDAEHQDGYKPEHIWLVFLTPDGRIPMSYREEAAGAKLCVWSYHQHVRNWLFECLPATQAQPRLLHTLHQYLDLLATYHNQHISQHMSVQIAQYLLDNRILAEAHAIQQGLVQARIELQLLFWQDLQEQLERLKIPLADHMDWTFSRQRVTDCYLKKRGSKGYGIATVLLEGERDHKQLVLWIELDKTLRFTVYVHKDEQIAPAVNFNKSKFARTEMQNYADVVPWAEERVGESLCWKPVDSVAISFLPFELSDMELLAEPEERGKLAKKVALETKRLHTKFRSGLA